MKQYYYRYIYLRQCSLCCIFFSLQIVSKIKVYIIPMTILLDIGLVVGFSVVSIPFLNLANPKYVNSTYSDRLQVKLLIHLN